MNGSLLLVLSGFLIGSPAILRPQKYSPAVPKERPEIHGWLRVLSWLNLSYCLLWHRVRTNGPAPVPESGPAILIANHTCGIDHLVLQAGCRRVLGFMIAREYYEWPWLRPLCDWLGCIPVNRDGRDLQATREALRALERGRVLPVFPEGRITPSSGRELGEMRPGAAFLAIRAGVPVIPAYIRGTPETNDIVRSLCTRSRAQVTFGQPIELASIVRGRAGDRGVRAEVSRRFREALIALRDDHLESDAEDGQA